MYKLKLSYYAVDTIKYIYIIYISTLNTSNTFYLH